MIIVILTMLIIVIISYFSYNEYKKYDKIQSKKKRIAKNILKRAGLGTFNNSGGWEHHYKLVQVYWNKFDTATGKCVSSKTETRVNLYNCSYDVDVESFTPYITVGRNGKVIYNDARMSLNSLKLKEEK